MPNDFDPLDLTMLAATIAEGVTGHKDAPRWSQDDCEAVQQMAKMLHRLWLEVDETDSWSAVWCYEVTSPLGTLIAEQIKSTGESLQTLHEFAEATARRLVDEAI